MMRRQNNLTCNVFVQRTQEKLLPIVLNTSNKLDAYCTGKLAEWRWSKLLMPAKALGIGVRGRSG